MYYVVHDGNTTDNLFFAKVLCAVTKRISFGKGGERVEWSGPVKRRTGVLVAWGGEGGQRAGHKKTPRR